MRALVRTRCDDCELTSDARILLYSRLFSLSEQCLSNPALAGRLLLLLLAHRAVAKQTLLLHPRKPNESGSRR